eukprot:TRINITY_DN7231_c0_g1_i1.p1 TRINITY_DN7231_c0_g1~~TRINITY_DN7231_c0_g1_i1.p1  ORF type:complete len:1154 (+),score=135.81 TRINITY_DN7231_c0_g1_i1:1-3462(+)
MEADRHVRHYALLKSSQSERILIKETGQKFDNLLSVLKAYRSTVFPDQGASRVPLNRCFSLPPSQRDLDALSTGVPHLATQSTDEAVDGVSDATYVASDSTGAGTRSFAPPDRKAVGKPRSSLVLTSLTLLLVVSVASASNIPILGLASCLGLQASNYGGIQAMFEHFDQSGLDGSWDKLDAKRFLSHCSVDSSELDLYTSRFMVSFDSVPPYSSVDPGLIELADLNAGLEILGWSSSINDFSPELPDFALTSLPSAPSRCPNGCPAPWPTLRRKTSEPTSVCQIDLFTTCMRSSGGCEMCDKESFCRLSEVLIRFRSPRLRGAPLMTARSFLPNLIKLDDVLNNCSSVVEVSRSYVPESITMLSSGLAFEMEGNLSLCVSNKLATLDLIYSSNSGIIHSDIANLSGVSQIDKMRESFKFGCYQTVLSPILGSIQEEVTSDVYSSRYVTDSTCMEHKDVLRSCSWWLSCFNTQSTCGLEDFATASHSACSVATGDSGLHGRGAEVRDAMLLCVQNTAARDFVVNRPASECDDLEAADQLAEPVHQQCMIKSGICDLVSSGQTDSTAFMDMLNRNAVLKNAACQALATCYPAIDRTSPQLARIDCVLSSNSQQTIFLPLPSGVNLRGISSLPAGPNRLDEYAQPRGLSPLGDLFDACGSDAICGNDDDIVSKHATNMVSVAELLSKHQTEPRHMVTYNGQQYNRFFRMDLDLLQCLELLRSSSQSTRITVSASYQTASERMVSPYGSDFARAGLALVLKYHSEAAGPAAGLRMAVRVLHTCAPIMNDGSSLMGLALYRHAVGVYHVKPSVRSFSPHPAEITDWQETPLAFAIAHENAGVDSSEFERLLKTGVPLPEECNSMQLILKGNDDIPPSGLDPDYVYPEVIDRRRRRRAIDPVFDFCEASKEDRRKLTATMWREIEQMAVDNLFSASLKRRLPQARAAFSDCLNMCNDVGANLEIDDDPEALQLEAACSEAVHRLPISFGTETEMTDSCHLYSLSTVNNNYRTQRMRDNACTLGRCLDKTPVFAFWERVMKTEFIPKIDGVVLDSEPLWGNDQPTPVFKLMQETYAMECRGSVVVWIMDAQEVYRMAGTLRALFVYNAAVTSVELRTDSAEKQAVEEALVELIEGWKVTACDTPRLVMAFYTVTALDEL